MMFRNTERLRGMFQTILDNRDLEVPTCYDQTIINMIVHNTMAVEILPETWNYVVWERPKSDEAYVNHFVHAGPSLA